MSTVESNSLIQYKSEDGNIHIIYPVTKAENVDGIEDISVTGNAGTATAFKMQNIPSGSDLDNFVTPGFYSSKNGTITSTILNKPVFNISGSASFSMYVFYWYGNTVNNPICQLVVAGTTNMTNEIHIRIRYASAWGEWKKVICDSDLNTELEKYVKKSGGTMTGKLTLSGTPTANLHAATKQYVDTGLNEKADTQDLTSHTGNKNNPHGVTAAQVGAVPKSGGTMTGKLTLSGNPSSNLHAATKQYVDNSLAGKLDKSGGTMTGALTLSGDPTSDLHAATKQYVDELTPVLKTVTLSTSGWTASGNVYTKSVTVSGVLSSEITQMLFVTPSSASLSHYRECGIYASKQATNSLTFTASKIPTSSLTVYITIQDL